MELIYKEENYAIIGAAMEVYNQLGSGFLEAVYQEALEMEFAERGIPFISQPEIKIKFKDKTLRKCYIPDFTAYGKIVVELKAMDQITSRETAQLINQLKCTGYYLGILINFGNEGKLEWERRVLTKSTVTGKNTKTIKV